VEEVRTTIDEMSHVIILSAEAPKEIC